MQLLTAIHSQCKASNSVPETVSPLAVEEKPVVLFVPIRRHKVKAQPEQVMEWLRSRAPRPDGRVYVRMSEYCAAFGIGEIKRAETFYYVLNGLAQREIIQLERWRLERLENRTPTHRGFKTAWAQREVVYAFTPIPETLDVRFDTYVDPTETFQTLSKEERAILWAQAEGLCSYCRKVLSVETVVCDHKMPRSRGGKHVWTNFAAACTPCNNDKHALTPDEFRLKLRRTNAGGGH